MPEILSNKADPVGSHRRSQQLAVKMRVPGKKVLLLVANTIEVDFFFFELLISSTRACQALFSGPLFISASLREMKIRVSRFTRETRI
jgi:hypothetical protein